MFSLSGGSELLVQLPAELQLDGKGEKNVKIQDLMAELAHGVR